MLLLSGCSGIFGSQGGPSEAETPTASPIDVDTETPAQDDGTAEAGTATAIETPERDIATVLLDRSDISADYVLIGELHRTGENRSDDMIERSVSEWHRRTFQQNESVDGPLLVTSSARRYETPDDAQAGLQRRADPSAELNASVRRTTPSSGTELTVVTFRSDSGTYGVTALYRTDKVLLTVQTFGTDRYHEATTEELLLKMIGYAA
ncbi:hypothetical protein [Halomicrobium salinisoli]|uniref:hypothetical protein n=1 Tax=Halomicrobium salinisoli TaxID=2878391 RepID=UPI001CF03994|nr:hypothetical protein [Halomicrobium salinisoli]